MVQAGVERCGERREVMTEAQNTRQVKNFVYHTKCNRETVEGLWGVIYPIFIKIKNSFVLRMDRMKASNGSWAGTFWYSSCLILNEFAMFIYYCYFFLKSSHLNTIS